ncbi:BBT_HP_G0132110.mRNA.1.CDS.1 [Saccharomyces cerevisiae]|nr:BBT_HP_G0132110.mRNA.1.CDS.1 [Saccharomyces cerevisiae]CAI6975776.1 BBT_HP_G0132110.mRNA.1.CDS.1 [Saccharomyces cerevisiae]
MSHHKKRVYPQAQVPYICKYANSCRATAVSTTNRPSSLCNGQPQLNNRANSFTQLAQNQQFPGSGKVVNQLYPVDLFTELPPPIRDLSLPPPQSPFLRITL